MGFTLRADQKLGREMTVNSLRSGKKRPMLQAPCSWGKCLGKGTPIIMLDGTIKPVEAVVVGDQLMGPDSQPRLVTTVCSGREMLYRVIPKRGEPFVANESHILSFKRQASDTVVNLSIRDLLQKAPNFLATHRSWKPAGIDFPDSGAERLLEPYFLGIWLGDGRKHRGCVQVTTPDQEVISYLQGCAESLQCRVRMEPNSENSVNVFIVEDASWLGRKKVGKWLEDYGLFQEKHIPHCYKVADRQTRLELLAGILDADGELDHGHTGFVICQKSERLIDDIIFLARSLGFACHKRSVRKTCCNTGAVGDYFITHIGGGCERIPTRLPRRRAKSRCAWRSHLSTAIEVSQIGEGEYFGFELAGPDRLFLLGDFTVTHNTIFAAELFNGVLSKNKRAIFTVPSISLIDQTNQKFFRAGIYDVGIIQANHPQTNLKAPIQIASVQTLMRRKEIPQADLVMVDEAHWRFKFYSKWMNDPDWLKVPFIGLSGTPWSKGLAADYDDLLIPITAKGMLEQGLSSPYRVFAPQLPGARPDKEALGKLPTEETQAGRDYARRQLSKLMRGKVLIGNALQTWLEKAEDRPTLVFCVDREHAQDVEYEYRNAGITTAYIDMNTSRNDREIIGRKFNAGLIKCIMSVGTLIVGVDWDVRCVQWLRPTKSEIIWCQANARSFRLAEGKEDTLILDHSWNTDTLGYPTDIHHDYLDDGTPKTSDAKKKEKEEREERIPGECRYCGYYKPKGRRICPDCGRGGNVEIEILPGELVEVRSSGKTNPALDRQLWYSGLLSIADFTQKQEGWAAHKFKEKFKEFPNGLARIRTEPTKEIQNFVRSRQISWAHSRRNSERRVAA